MATLAAAWAATCLLRPVPSPHTRREQHLNGEQLGMVWPAGAHHLVARGDVVLGLGPHLELAFIVFVQGVGHDFGQRRTNKLFNQRFDGQHPLVQVEGTNNRFKGGAQQRGAFPAAVFRFAIT
jgi:hypothetical protein